MALAAHQARDLRQNGLGMRKGKGVELFGLPTVYEHEYTVDAGCIVGPVLDQRLQTPAGREATGDLEVSESPR
jgi:hypothetical protein